MAFTNSWPVNGLNPSTVGGTGITAKYFPFPSGNFTSGIAPTPGPTATSGYGQLAIHGTEHDEWSTYHHYVSRRF